MPIFRAICAEKVSAEFWGIGVLQVVCGKGGWNFWTGRCPKFNYWEKVQRLTVNSFQFTVQRKVLWDKEMGKVTGVKTLQDGKSIVGQFR